MTHSVEILQPIINLVLLVFALDVAISGLLVLTLHQDVLIKPKLLGLAIMKWVRTSADKMRGRNTLVDWLLNPRLMAASYLLGGLILVCITISTLMEIFGY